MYIYTICNTRVDLCEWQKNAAHDVHVNEFSKQCAKTMTEILLDFSFFFMFLNRQLMFQLSKTILFATIRVNLTKLVGIHGEILRLKILNVGSF